MELEFGTEFFWNEHFYAKAQELLDDQQVIVGNDHGSDHLNIPIVGGIIYINEVHKYSLSHRGLPHSFPAYNRQ